MTTEETTGPTVAVDPGQVAYAAVAAQLPEPTDAPFAGWTILELLGHRRLAGWLTEAQIAGASFLRLDIPSPDGPTTASQYYSPGSVYAITPTSEATARLVARTCQPAPVQRWELPALQTSPGRDEQVDGAVGEDVPW